MSRRVQATLEPDEMRRLNKLLRRMRMPRAQLLRLLVARGLDHLEATHLRPPGARLP